MLADAGASVLLTRSALHAHLPAHDATSSASMPARHRAAARDRTGHQPRTAAPRPPSHLHPVQEGGRPKGLSSLRDTAVACSAQSIQFPNNIELARKHLDKIAEALK